jgi:hypothetical protein
MANIYDAILGKYRKYDLSAGASFGGGVANTIPFLNSAGTLQSNAELSYNSNATAKGITNKFSSVHKTISLLQDSGGVQSALWGAQAGFNQVATLYADSLGDSHLFLSNGSIATTYYAGSIKHNDSYFGIQLEDSGVDTFQVSTAYTSIKTGELALRFDLDLSSNDVPLFSFGNDTSATFYGTPFRCFWDSTSSEVAFDFGVGSYQPIRLRADLNAQVLSANYSTLIDATISNASIYKALLSPNVATDVPLIVRGAYTTASRTPITSVVCQPAQTFTVTLASPAVFTTPVAHNFIANDLVKVTTTGTLYTGLSTTAFYYVRNPSGVNFELSLSSGGASISTSGSQSGVHTVTMFARVTCAGFHSLSPDDPIILGTSGALNSPLAPVTTYYASTNGMTGTVFYLKSTVINSVAAHIATTTAGSGSHYFYGTRVDLIRVQNSAGSDIFKVDRSGALYANLLTQAVRIGPIPADSNYVGIWFGNAAVASPTASNYGFLGDSVNTFLNAATTLWCRVGNASQVWFTSGTMNFAEATNEVLGTTTGSKRGTASNQKQAFWGATPIVQPTTAFAGGTFVANTGTAMNDASTVDGYNFKQVVAALRAEGLLA